MLHLIQIKSLIIVAALCQSVLRIEVVHLCIIAPGQPRFIRRNAAMEVIRWQHCDPLVILLKFEAFGAKRLQQQTNILFG